MMHTPGRPAARPPAIRVPRFTPEQRDKIGRALDALLKRIREQLQPLFRLVRDVAQALSESLERMRPQMQQLADTLKQANRDRPAWVSPYGPAPRRRHA